MPNVKKLVSGWGQYPQHLSEVIEPSEDQLIEHILQSQNWIARGLGRSYGDSAVAEQVISSLHLNQVISFNKQSGILHCQSGVSLADIIQKFLPLGWALPVTPGTQWVTVGGAIASDVHGKNHHHEGCFSDYVIEFELLTTAGEKITCSAAQNPEIFFATCGGMGLTGFILNAKLRLMPVSTHWINQVSVKTASLEETIAVLQEYQSATYSVAWADALASKKKIGRSHVFLGEHVRQGELQQTILHTVHKFPYKIISPFLHPIGMKIFNTAYFHRQRERVQESILNWHQYFYPLDKLYDWHQLYGRSGFTQYQFIVPATEIECIKKIFLKAQQEQATSALTVIKICGAANHNYLSFPVPGISVAMDFKISASLWKVLDYLDGMVVEGGGRVYLAKDCRLSAERFRQMYPYYESFRTIREQLDPQGKIQSLQSRRLNI